MNTIDVKRKDVLLADDDDDDVMVFEMALKETEVPAALSRAEDGEQLFTMLQQLVPDLLFLDIDMPCKDGISCIIEIRKNKNYDTLPVIMYTAHSADKYVEDSFRNGANLYLNKSRSFADLIKSLKNILSLDWKNQMFFPPRQQFVVN